MQHAAAHLARWAMAGPVLLVIAVACLSPSPAVARSLLQTVGVKNVTVPDPLSSLCAVVAGQTTTECRPGCQVCQAVFDPNNDRNWVPQRSERVSAARLAACLTRKSRRLAGW